MTDIHNVTADELLAFVERIEWQNASIKEKTELRAEIFSEAKGCGYDTKIMKRIIALRKITADALAEQEAIEDMYRSALGM